MYASLGQQLGGRGAQRITVLEGIGQFQSQGGTNLVSQAGGDIGHRKSAAGQQQIDAVARALASQANQVVVVDLVSFFAEVGHVVNHQQNRRADDAVSHGVLLKVAAPEQLLALGQDTAQQVKQLAHPG